MISVYAATKATLAPKLQVHGVKAVIHLVNTNQPVLTANMHENSAINSHTSPTFHTPYYLLRNWLILVYGMDLKCASASPEHVIPERDAYISRVRVFFGVQVLY